MKGLLRVLSALLLTAPFGAGAAVPGTVGSNLTAYNNNMGAINNNQWNNAVHSRASNSAANAPTADFGNCNALIMRCAQPKCAGCTSIELAAPIVEGCVRTSENCSQYGDALVQYMAAQLVSTATAKQNAAEVAAAQNAAAQSAQQIAQMQNQMLQMQADMAAQNAETVAQLQNALEEQKQLTAQAIAEAAAQNAAPAATTTGTTASGDGSVVGELTATQRAAVENGIDADVLVREQITGQMYTRLENAEKSMAALKKTMQTAFDYAGCDNRGDNCTGPKRVKVFKEYALQFFDPYENVLDEVWEALILAQTVGVDITDIYMMLNDACNSWGQYLCGPDQVLTYTTSTCDANGKSKPGKQRGKRLDENGKYTTDNFDVVLGKNNACVVGGIVPVWDGGCQLIRVLKDKEEVRRNWLYPDDGDTGTTVRVGCASEAMNSIPLFRSRAKKQARIDTETLQRIIEQDAPSVYGTNRSKTTTPANDGLLYCAVTEKGLENLERSVSLKQLPTTICKTKKKLQSDWDTDGAAFGSLSAATSASLSASLAATATQTKLDALKQSQQTIEENTQNIMSKACTDNGGKWVSGSKKCDCSGAADRLTCRFNGLYDVL